MSSRGAGSKRPLADHMKAVGGIHAADVAGDGASTLRCECELLISHLGGVNGSTQWKQNNHSISPTIHALNSLNLACVFFLV